MRLEGQTKLGYYPTPDHSLRLLTTWIKTTGEDSPRRYLDPCSGQGEALAYIATHVGPAETFGIELSDVRAADAARVLDHVINTGFEYARLTDETFSLCLLNPPYDGEGETGGGRRMEETFLLDTTPLLAPGGVLIYIIPHTRINEKIARHLAGWYSDLRCFTLAGEDYATFKQVVIFGVRRSEYAPAGSDDLRAAATALHRPVLRRAAVEAWAEAKVILDYTTVEVAEAEGRVEKVRRPVYAPLPELTEGHGEYIVPLSPLKGRRGVPFRFQYEAVHDDDYLRAAEDAATALESSRAWRDLIPVTEPPVIEPAMTPKKGHIAMQVNGGLLGTNLVRAANGAPLLLKGNVRKYTVVKHGDPLDEDAELNPNDNEEVLHKVELEERFESVITTLDAEGNLIVHSDAASIKNLLEQHVEQLAEVVQARNVPQYDMKPEPWEWAVFDHLSTGRRLPSRDATGLTDFQKHLAIALGRLCLKHGAGFANAEMASGKSTIGLASAEYIHAALARRGNAKSAYPALIVGPGIVTGVENWPKEIAEVTPGAAARVVSVGAKPLPRPMKIGRWLRERMNVALDEETLQGLDPAPCLIAILNAAKKSKAMLSANLVAALRQSLEQAGKNPPNRRKGAKAPNLLDGRLGGGYLWLGMEVPRDEDDAREVAGKYSLIQFIDEYGRGDLPERSFAILSYETAKLGPGRRPAMSARPIRVTYRDDDDSVQTKIVRVCVCAGCGAIVADKYDDDSGQPFHPIRPGRQAEEWIGLRRRFCQAPQPRRTWDEEQGKHIVKAHDEDGRRHVCGAPLFEDSALRREAAARIARRVKGFFGLLLVDEVHKAKAKGTGVGWTLTVLNNACRWTVGLTGTLFGGYSTSIFWLLYRLSGEVRRVFAFNDERRWAEKFGLLKTTFYIGNPDAVGEDGTYTGTKHFETVTEKPGISPAIAGVGLKYCTFSSLKDIGLPLPDYGEEIVRLKMTPAMWEQYAQVDGSQSDPPAGLLAWALDRMKEEDGKGAISVWLNAALNRPDAMFRDEEIVFRPRVSGRGRFAVRKVEHVLDAPRVFGDDEWSPKEKWVARQCRLERDQGRKTLVYVRQTGERDIQPRIAQALEAAGLRVGILRPSLAPAKRAPWLKANARRFDVMLTNARLVEVGLNLTMFNTAIFYEIEYSLYVVWQSMRRLYRPGAPLPVRLYFPVYAHSMEERALDLVGHKMLAGQVFYGDEVSGALVEDCDEGDLLGDLLRVAMGKLDIGRAEGVFAAGNPSLVTNSPMGSPTAVSPLMKTWAELARARQAIFQPRRRVSRVASVPEQQLTLL